MTREEFIKHWRSKDSRSFSSDSKTELMIDLLIEILAELKYGKENS